MEAGYIIAIALAVIAAVCAAAGVVGYRPADMHTPRSVRPFVAKIVEMLEKGDYTEERASEDFSTACWDIYNFALDERLSCNLTVYGRWDSPSFVLYLSGECLDMTADERRSIELALSEKYIARQRAAETEIERVAAERNARIKAARAEAIAKIEAYKPIDRRATK